MGKNYVRKEGKKHSFPLVSTTGSPHLTTYLQEKCCTVGMAHTALLHHSCTLVGANAHHFCTTPVLETMVGTKKQLLAPGEATTGENKTHQHLAGTWGCLFTSSFVSTPQSWQCAAAVLPAPRLLCVSCWPTRVDGWRLNFPFICVFKNPFWLWVRQQELRGFMSVFL